MHFSSDFYQIGHSVQPMYIVLAYSVAIGHMPFSALKQAPTAFSKPWMSNFLLRSFPNACHAGGSGPGLFVGFQESGSGLVENQRWRFESLAGSMRGMC